MLTLAITVGFGLTGVMLYMFTTENLRQYAVFNVMGAPARMLIGMIFAQAGLCAVLGTGLGLGLCGIVGQMVSSAEYPFRMMWFTPLLGVVMIVLVSLVAAAISPGPCSGYCLPWSSRVGNCLPEVITRIQENPTRRLLRRAGPSAASGGVSPIRGVVDPGMTACPSKLPHLIPAPQGLQGHGFTGWRFPNLCRRSRQQGFQTAAPRAFAGPSLMIVPEGGVLCAHDAC
jgi:hypothetical protein